MSLSTTLPAWGFRADTEPGHWLALLTRAIEVMSGVVLAVDVLVVFVSVVF